MGKEWFILQFKLNAHHQANRNLSQQGFQTFLPLHVSTLQNKSRFINIKRPLFPGYMFISFDRKQSKWQSINNTYGVLRLVTFNSILSSIPNEVMNNLMARCDSSGELLPIKKLKKGDHVKVSSGPFTNFFATVEKYETDQRIWILMDLMGRKAKIQTPIEDLEVPV